MSTTAAARIDQLAQAAAEHITRDLIPEQDRLSDSPGVTIHYVNGRRPPRDVDAIKAALLAGEIWTSWMDEHVLMAVRAIRQIETGGAA